MTLTVAQEDIKRYIATKFKGGYKLTPIGDYTMELMDKSGETMRFTINLFGDIMDADTQQIIAMSDLPHHLDKLKTTARPGRWTNQPSYFVEGGGGQWQANESMITR